MMNVQFVLPGVSKQPIGGYKVVYEYANRLIEKFPNEFNCTMLFMCGKTLQKYPFPNGLRKKLVQGLVSYFPKWFHLSHQIKKKAIFDWTDNEVPDADFIIATGNSTVKCVEGLSDIKGKRIYLIQDFEKWGNTTEEWLYKTYGMGMTNIVVSKWLKKIVDEHCTVPSEYIPNGLDFDAWGIDNQIENRNPFSIAMLYHANPVKGCRYGIDALKMLKNEYSQLKVHMFGTAKRPKDLPNWIIYTRNASQEQLKKIYNQSAIYLCSTLKEGFGLCGAESMACGCALVSTNYEGVYEYAIDGRNSLLCEPQNAAALANNVRKLFSDNNLRISLAQQGNQDIQKLSWDNSVAMFANLLERLNNQ